ncbi:platelet glycoprotein V [Dunckerocampus dactyliophorus]|uniref:platelet glycoprotein V n=1 Tax=Dunckerocampus dactyliophorus TaxID=161453 RepID=UPI0024051EA0|nr:platelet glycoprotein V [Dunckerocampus dactyliophorus]
MRCYRNDVIEIQHITVRAPDVYSPQEMIQHPLKYLSVTARHASDRESTWGKSSSKAPWSVRMRQKTMESYLGGVVRMILVTTMLPLLTSNQACPSVCRCSLQGNVGCSGDTITDTPKQLPLHTYTLQLHATNMNVIHEHSLENKDLLTRFSLTFSRLHTIHPRAFNATPKLKSIQLSANNLASLPVRLFSPLTTLEQLHLNRNQLENITVDMFEGLVALEELDLSHNKLSSLASGAFSGLMNLTTLKFGNNFLQTLPPDSFRSLTKLQQLIMPYNKLERLEPGIFDGLVKLEYLQMHYNQIASIPQRVFWSLRSLKNLTLSTNQLQTVPERSFYHMPKMSKLTLYNNPLSSLPDELMGHMPEIQEFYLYYTNLTTVPGNLFANMSGLQYLNLHLNKRLRELPSDVFCCLPELRKLSLKSNNLQEMHPHLFSRLTSLGILLLNENKLKKIPMDTFQELGLLTTLDLKNNQLNHLPEDIFQSNPFLKVSLSNNPWDCTCRIRGFARWVRRNKHAVVDNEHAICHSPQHQALRTLDSLRDEEWNICDVMTVTPSCVPTPTQQSSTTGSTTTRLVTIPTTSSATEAASSLQPLARVTPEGAPSTYDSSAPFYDKLVVEGWPEFVHHNHHNGWVYVWFLPSNAALAGFLTFGHVLLVATGLFLILSAMYAMHRLSKRVEELQMQFTHIEG